MKRYTEVKKQYQQQAAQAIIALASKLPDVKEAEIRTDATPTGVGEQEAQAELTAPAPQITVEMWQTALGNPVYEQVLDLIYNGKPLDSFASDAVTQLATQNGMTTQEVIDAIDNLVP